MKTRHSKFLTALAVAGFSLGAIVNSATAQETAALPALELNTKLEKFQFDSDKFIGQRFTAQCPSTTIHDKYEAISGTGVYSSKSPICVAAIHDGKITADAGGMVTVQLNPGVEAYTASSQNGVDSTGLNNSKRSMVFIDAADTTTADAAQAPYIPRLKWDTKFSSTGFGHKQFVGQRFTFNCPAAPSGKLRRITGTDSYANNTRVCVAAMHAGKITQDGGLIHLQLDPGKKKLVGSLRNGVESKDGPGGHQTVSFVDSPLVN
ncbi:LCCL domain-containing protein [Denitrobaculum tricleocarpae]|uniref:LCCL domain-containing protein n=1 Tax=Denitrobaculum tricleocarpae TaxID=2591009 RepID=A0A545TEU7_9PROT|nr:LCCL domain-containing protein [Denitrobaculum tricleocarpae]TQV75754.1 hypothetical protein FKG95_22850 [Denitrobaculum tricleocarpae]